MQVNRGELFTDPAGPARRPGLEATQAAQPVRRAGESPAVREAEAPSELRQRVLVAQRHVARAQAVLAGLEGFRDFLLEGAHDESETRNAILRASYQGESVLKPHGETLLAIAARNDLPLLERWIATVRETAGSIAAEAERGQSVEPAGVMAQVLEGIRQSSPALQRLQRENVLKLLS
jgi:hypothetical protein